MQRTVDMNYTKEIPKYLQGLIHNVLFSIKIRDPKTFSKRTLSSLRIAEFNANCQILKECFKALKIWTRWKQFFLNNCSPMYACIHNVHIRRKLQVDIKNLINDHAQCNSKLTYLETILEKKGRSQLPNMRL